MIAAAVYLLCCLASIACAFLLLRGYRAGGHRLLLWSGICFVGLATTNAVLVIDRLVVKNVDLSTWRLVPSAIGISVLVYGLVWEDDE